MNQYHRQLLFFILLFVLILPILYTSNNICIKNQNVNNVSVSAISSIFLIVLIIIFFYIIIAVNDDNDNNNSDVIDNYKHQPETPHKNRMLTIDPVNLCKGGWYMHQTDSPTDKMCRNMINSKNGQQLLRKYECSCGLVGSKPLHEVKFSPLSGLNWKNERNCPIKNV